MELALTAGLASLGYSLINKKENFRNSKNNETELSENNIPNSNEIYNSSHLSKTAEKLRTRAETNWENSKKPNETNIIPANYNKDFQNLSNLNNDENIQLYSSNYSSALQEFKEINNNEKKNQNEGFLEEFYNVSNHNDNYIPNSNNPNPDGHNNMVPFFGGSIKQNTRIDQHQTTLDLFTGSERLKPPKQEVEAMFKPEKNVGSTNGVGVSYNNDRSRFVQSNYQQGIKPFQEVRVAPGLNQGPTTTGTSGFHDTYRPPVKTVDELRVNKKVTYEGRIKPPKAVVTNRGKLGKLFKNLPEKFYKKGFGHLFKTTGAFTKERKREKYILKDQNRKISKVIQGGAGPATEEKHEARPTVQKDKKNTFCGAGMRHLGASGKWTTKSVNASGNDPSDYGKTSFKNYPNERNVTGERTVTSNLRSEVQKPTNQLDDKAKSTKKQLYTTFSRKGNARLRGTGQHTIPHTQNAKTTLKETLIHDNRQGSMAPQRPQQLRTYNPDSKARTTIKETLIHNNRKGNVKVATKKNVVYDKKEWKARTTLRQTNNNKYGSIDPKPVLTGPNKGKAYDPSDPTRTTIRETTENNKHNGNMSGKSGITKHQVHDPEDTAKTTVKETTIDNNYVGQANQEVMQNGMGYVTANKSATAPNTNRQYTSDVEHYGIANNENGDGYKVFKANAHNTNRQFTSDVEHFGTANSYAKSSMSYEDKYNAKLNALKEKIAKGRAPTQESVKLMSGGEKVLLEPRKKVSIEEKVHQAGLHRIYANTASEIANECEMTKIPNKDDNDNLAERIDDPNLLNAFKENPYTQPLDSTN
jgi:hypothetical protein